MKPTPKTAAEAAGSAPAAVQTRQRIDKWLWHARVVRTRSAAAALAGQGKVRVNGLRIDAPSRKVGPGDVITIALGRVLILKVLEFSERRGGSQEARLLYEDLDPSRRDSPSDPQAQTRGRRPTKRDRRAIDKLRTPPDM